MKLKYTWIIGILIFLFSLTLSSTVKAVEQSVAVDSNLSVELDEPVRQEESVKASPSTDEMTESVTSEKIMLSATEEKDDLVENSSEESSEEVTQIQGEEIVPLVSEQEESTEELLKEGATLAKNATTKSNETAEFISKSGHIIWDDEEDKEGFRPDSVEVTLYQNSKKMKKLIVEAGKNNDWTYVFDNLPKADAENNLYDYQVDVVRISNYLVFVDEMLITLALAAGSGINVLPDPPIEKVMRETLIISADEKKEKQATTNKKENSKTIDASATPSTNEAATTKMNHSETLPQTGSNSDFLFEFLGALLCCLGVGLCVRTIKIQ